MYGVSNMIFAAKEAVEKKARSKGREEGLEQGLERGLEQGRQAERARIGRLLAEHGVALSPEVLNRLNHSEDSE